MKTKEKSKNPKSVKLADLKAKKDTTGGAQKRENPNLRPKGGYGNHSETFLAD